MAVRPFQHLGREISAGEWVDLAAIDAAVKAHEGLVSLTHSRIYQTRDMVAAAPIQPVTLSSVLPSTATDPDPETPPKRRRGRPRKVRD